MSPLSLYDSCNASLTSLQAQYEQCGCGTDPCAFVAAD
jgi:hypothetical protein